MKHTEASEWVELGYISGVSGVKGWIKLYSYTRPRESLNSYKVFSCAPGDNAEKLRFEQIKCLGKNIIGKVSTVDNIERAEALVGKKLWVQVKDLKKSNDEYFWRELIGLMVKNQSGTELGHVAEIIETGANDVLVIKKTDCSVIQEATLIPYVMGHYIKEVNLENKSLLVAWETDWLKE